MAVKRPPDPEETEQEKAARIVDNAADIYLDRISKFETTLRSNAANLSTFKRRQTAAWLKKVHDRLNATVDENGGITPLGLSDYPDMD